MCHIFGDDPLVKLLGGEEAQGNGGFLETRGVFVGLLGDLRGFVVADVGIERGDEHEGIFHIACDDVQIRLDADCAMVVEGMAASRKQADGMKEIVNNKWLAASRRTE